MVPHPSAAFAEGGEKCFVGVDVSDEFPYLVTKLSPYYNR